jgi:type IV pilus assembly protein PilQ
MINKKIGILMALLSLALLGCATTGGERAAPGTGEPVTILAIDIEDNEVRLQMSEELKGPYTVYKPSDPYTVVVDLPGVDAGYMEGTIASNKEGISEVIVRKEYVPELLTKVEMLLESPDDVEARVEGGYLVLSVVKPEEEEPFEAAMPVEPVGELYPAEVIYDLGFTRTDDTLKLVISGDGFMKPSIFKLEDKVVIDVPGVEMKASVPEEVIYPVEFVRHGMYEERVRIVVGLEKGAEFVASTVDDTIVIAMPLEEEYKAPPEAVEAAPEMEEVAVAPPEEVPVEEEAEEVPVPVEGECTKRISLDFQDADVVPIFRFIGDICGYNVVIHPNVSGKINLKLMNVPANQAMDIILEITNLGMAFREEGRILTIAQTEVFTRQKEDEAKLKQVRMRVDELMEESFKLDFINAADMLDIINKKKVMSPRGNSYIDEVTNTLEITDTLNNIKDMRKLINKYDDIKHGTMQHGPMAQIMIEAKMVEVSTDYTRALGIRWGLSGTNDDFSFIDDDSSIDVSVNTPTQSAGSSSSAGGGIISIGYTETVQVNLSLEALESVGKTKSLANPRVLTLNKMSATISQGVQIPYTVIEDGTAKTEFQAATLSLNVTPEIRPDDFVELQVTASNDTPTQVGGDIGINTQSVTTKARVKNGETLVIGGIYTNTQSQSEDRIPGLGDIPILGWLFKTRTVSDSPKELLIFITPKIVN